jgi:hypothetical protein
MTAGASRGCLLPPDLIAPCHFEEGQSSREQHLSPMLTRGPSVDEQTARMQALTLDRALHATL